MRQLALDIAAAALPPGVERTAMLARLARPWSRRARHEPPGFIVPQNTNPSGKDCSHAASRTEIVRACSLPCGPAYGLVA
jgi:hypothetical protein